jgi:hypothetical protein
MADLKEDLFGICGTFTKKQKEKKIFSIDDVIDRLKLVKAGDTIGDLVLIRKQALKEAIEEICKDCESCVMNGGLDTCAGQEHCNVIKILNSKFGDKL